MTGTDERVEAGDAGARLVRLLERQLELCVELEAMSGEQGELIAAGDTDGLLRVLAARQGVIDAIQGLNAEMEPFRRDWEAQVARLTEPRRARVREMVEQVRGLIATVTQRDERDGALLGRQREQVAAQMEGVTRGRGAVNAYGAGASGALGGAGGAMYQDRRA